MKLRINKSITEEELIKACKKCDHKAQRELYQKYCDRMLGLCARYVRDYYEAEDIMIKGFVKAFTKLDQYGGEGSFEGWLRKIMVNEALGYLRKHKNLLMAVELEKAEKEPNYQTIQDNLEAADLLEMINELPDGYRAVFNLYAIEGYSHKEIAELLGISENTSKSQLSRARQYLQKNLLTQEYRLNKKCQDHEKA